MTEFQILQDRLAQVMGWSLKSGAHEANYVGNLCVMEAVAYVAGRPWSDSPPCVSPVIASFMRNWNDSLPSDSERDRLLKPLIPALIGTKSTDKLEERRSFMALDWLIRVHTPKWLDLVPALKPHALALRKLEEIGDLAGVTAAGVSVKAARDAAGDAWGAAGGAAWGAAWDAARGAARGAAGAAASTAASTAARDATWGAAGGAAGDAASTAAWAAARGAAGAAASTAAGDAARGAAGDAAGAALKPTTEWLQLSAVDLVKRMCKLTDLPNGYFMRAV